MVLMSNLLEGSCVAVVVYMTFCPLPKDKQILLTILPSKINQEI